jgi:hypothetical protein
MYMEATQDQLVFDRPAKLSIYNDILKVLEDMTGLRWGWMPAKASSKYISSVEFPIKIGVEFIKTKARTGKKTASKYDVVVENNTLNGHIDQGMWAEATVVELRDKLVLHIGRIEDPLLRAKVGLRIQRRSPRGDYAVVVSESLRSPIPTSSKVFDVWLDECQRRRAPH